MNDDIKGLCEELQDIARRGCGINCSIEGEFTACAEAATALSTLSRELAEAKAERDAMVKERDAALGLYLGGTMARRAFAAEAASASKDERIRELEAALEPFATSCSVDVLEAFDWDESVLMLVRAGKLSPTGISVGDLRRARSTKEPT